MLSGTPAQDFLTLQRPLENNAYFKSIFQWFAALLAIAEGCSCVVIFTLCLTKGFQWQ